MEKSKKERFIDAIKEDILVGTDYEESWVGGYKRIDVVLFGCAVSKEIKHGSVGSYFLRVPTCFRRVIVDRYGLDHSTTTKLFEKWYEDIVVDMYDSKNRG